MLQPDSQPLTCFEASQPILKPVNWLQSRSHMYEVPEWTNFLRSAHEVLARQTVASCSVYTSVVPMFICSI